MFSGSYDSEIDEGEDEETTKPFPSVNETGNSTAHNATEVIVTVINEDDTNEDELEAGNFKNM